MIHEGNLADTYVKVRKGRPFISRGRSDGEAMHDVIKVNCNNIPTGVAISVRDADGLDALSEEAGAKVARHNDAISLEMKSSSLALARLRSRWGHYLSSRQRVPSGTTCAVVTAESLRISLFFIEVSSL